MNPIFEDKPEQQPAAPGRTNASPKAQPASPEQQAQFDLLLGRARQVMGEAADEWLATLQADPVEGAITLGTQTVRQMVQMSEQAGQPVAPVVLMHVGIQICKDVAAVANEAGLVKDENLPSYLQDTLQGSIAAYLEMDAEDGLLSQDDRARAQQMLGQQPAQPANVMDKIGGPA
ncbi:MAG: hypothetical protein LCH79_15235 [Proteobacteria bacterium]|nr:hypothetical protein [Pseudomonadota bacterium]